MIVFFSSYLARKELQQQKEAAKKIQQAYRGYRNVRPAS